MKRRMKKYQKKAIHDYKRCQLGEHFTKENGEVLKYEADRTCIIYRNPGSESAYI